MLHGILLKVIISIVVVSNFTIHSQVSGMWYVLKLVHVTVYILLCTRFFIFNKPHVEQCVPHTHLSSFRVLTRHFSVLYYYNHFRILPLRHYQR